MTRRYVVKAIRVLDANGQACIAYREVTPIEEYGKWAVYAFEAVCCLVALTFVVFLVLTTNGII